MADLLRATGFLAEAELILGSTKAIPRRRVQSFTGGLGQRPRDHSQDHCHCSAAAALQHAQPGAGAAAGKELLAASVTHMAHVRDQQWCPLLRVITLPSTEADGYSHVLHRYRRCSREKEEAKHTHMAHVRGATWARYPARPPSCNYPPFNQRKMVTATLHRRLQALFPSSFEV